jgi:hypothetical protein
MRSPIRFREEVASLFRGAPGDADDALGYRLRNVSLFKALTISAKALFMTGINKNVWVAA